MGLVARYIDALSDEQRDRIIEAERFNDSHHSYFVHGCGCLVGVAEYEEAARFQAQAARFKPPIERRLGEDELGYAGDHFPLLCERFGTERITRLVKARAAKGNRVRTIRREINGNLKTVTAEAATR